MSAKTLVARATLLLAAGMTAALAWAQAPQGSTGECKDGTYTTAPSKRGACSGHGGVKDWYEAKKGESKAAPAPKATTEAQAPATTTTAKPAPTKTSEMPTSAAAGGGPGKVWVNSSSKVYHCQGDRWYGKTKKGEYMSEAEAKAAGNRPDHGKACS